MYEELKLSNGIRIVHEKMPQVRSASVGIWVGAGSRCESSAQLGSAHFVEHMMFKGTSSHTAAQLAASMDRMGGQVNAYTSKEHTCYHARVPDYHLDSAISLLGEMLLDSRFAPENVESERGVILEEMDMYHDSPEDMAVDRLFEKCFKGALGKNGLGTAATLAAATGESLRAFRDANYTPDRMVISLCGSYTDAHLAQISDIFGSVASRRSPGIRKSSYTPALTLKRKATEQNQIVIGFPGCCNDSDDRFKQVIMSSILGGGMSSRLFQTLREQHGLCYNVFSFSSGFMETGIFAIAAGLGSETEDRALRLIKEELRRLLDDGVTAAELEMAVDQAKSSLLMAQESTSSRMSRNGSGVLTVGKCLSPDEIIARYETVTRDDIRDYARSIFAPEMCSLSAVGRVRPADEYRKYLR